MVTWNQKFDDYNSSKFSVGGKPWICEAKDLWNKTIRLLDLQPCMNQFKVHKRYMKTSW